MEKSTVESFTLFKGRPMVRIAGNFYGKGFNLSKNKAIAIMENIDVIKEFADGKFDDKILELGEEEVLEYKSN